MRQSAITTYLNCPYKYKLQYINGLNTIPDGQAGNALVLGSAIHLGVETGSINNALEYYYNQFHIIDDLQINEAIKLEVMLPKVLRTLDNFEKVEHEVEFHVGGFHGTVDLIVHHEDGTVDIYDFKYSNNIKNYLESPQLHIYKYYLEKQGFKINRLGFIFIPKTQIRQKKTEDLYQFRRRLINTLSTMEPTVEYIDYDTNKVLDSFNTAIEMLEANEFPKNPNRLCDWCQYQQFCERGLDYMLLPENRRREVKINTSPDMWLYGDSYSGKTVFMDSFDDVLMINTDGNIDHISSPVIRIKDDVTVEGRLTKRKFAWEVFLEVVAELEKKENTFKIIVIDLVEDIFEHCRLYMYNKLNIEHEQDAGYGKGWDMVRTEFLSTMKRLKNCGYQLVYISKVQVSEITKRNGEKITTIKPNINDKVANVLAGTVDLTARVVADGDNRYLSFKTSPYIFGGSRYNFGVDQIELNKDVFIKTLEKSQMKKDEPDMPKRSMKEPVSTEKEITPKHEPTAEAEEKPRRRRSRKTEDEEVQF